MGYKSDKILHISSVEDKRRRFYRKKEEKENVAKKLLQQKIDINVIIHATGLTKEEIEKL